VDVGPTGLKLQQNGGNVPDGGKVEIKCEGNRYFLKQGNNEKVGAKCKKGKLESDKELSKCVGEFGYLRLAGCANVDWIKPLSFIFFSIWLRNPVGPQQLIYGCGSNPTPSLHLTVVPIDKKNTNFYLRVLPVVTFVKRSNWQKL
jgi:hypothetical protein